MFSQQVAQALLAGADVLKCVYTAGHQCQPRATVPFVEQRL